MIDILILDDDRSIRESLSMLLSEKHYETRTCASYDEFLYMIKKQLPDLVIIDVWLVGSKKDGLQILSEFNNKYPSIPILMISGHGNINMAVESLKIGAFDFIEKPFSSERLFLAIERSLEKANLNHSLNKFVSFQNFTLIGNSKYIEKINKQAKDSSLSDKITLISGDHGTGKYSLALETHYLSEKKNLPFTVENCLSIDVNEFEKSFFGSYDKDTEILEKGIISNSKNGTILLEDVEHMPKKFQAKFVKFFNKKSFKLKNLAKEFNFNPRFAFLTCKKVDKNFYEKYFIKELAELIEEINLQPLENHKEDIAELVEFYLRNFSKVTGSKKIDISEEVMDKFQQYDWPGNIKELRNLIEYLIILANLNQSSEITMEHLNNSFFINKYPKSDFYRIEEIFSYDIKKARELFEKEYLAYNLRKYRNNISKMASAIMLERSSLHKKINSLGLNKNK